MSAVITLLAFGYIAVMGTKCWNLPIGGSSWAT